MISRLIEARPEDLRTFLEEAAGISKYKERRRETENRMKHTRENLDRLNDLREEVDKQLNHLQRQARTAERYKELKQEERRLKAELVALRLNALDQEASGQEKAIAERETGLEAALAEQRAIEAALEKDRDAHVEATDGFNEVQGRFYGVGADIARLEQSIQHAKEMRQRQQRDLDQLEQSWRELQHHIEQDGQRLQELDRGLEESAPALERLREVEEASREALTQAEEALQEWQRQWEDFNRLAAEPSEAAQVERTRIDHLERQIVQLQSRMERLQAERQALGEARTEEEIGQLEQDEARQAEQSVALQAELEQVLGRINELREQNRERNTSLDEQRGELQDLRGRLASLEALQQAALGQTEGAVSEWLAGRGLRDAPRLAQELDVDSGWEQAVETVLGFHLEAVCVEGMDAVAGVLGSLEHGALSLFDTRASAAEAPAHELATPLTARVRAPWAVDGLLAGVYTADSLSAALALRDRLGPQESVVTPDGVWIGHGWLRVARDPDERAGVLGREQEIKSLGGRLEQVTAQVAELEGQLEQGREQLHDLEERRETVQRQVNDSHRRDSELRAKLGAVRARHEQNQNRAQAMATELAELAEQEQRDGAEAQEARRRLNAALERMEQLALEREQLNARREQLREATAEARARAHADRDEAHRLALQVESMRSQQISTRQSLERMEAQVGGLQSRRSELSELLAGADAPLQEQEAELAQLLQQRVQVEQELAAARSRMEEIDEAVRRHEQERHAAEQKVLEVRGLLEQARLGAQEIKIRRQTLREQLAETGFEQKTLLEELSEEADESSWHEKVEQMATRIARLGPINLAAIDEFAEQSERKKYLDAQHADVTEALETLENAIRKIDRETRTRFKETFDKVNTGLQALFPRLFGGGHAYLELTGEDLLDTGVTVMARPPGKRNSSIHLLSGGEKALTAVALVFSIFQLNPAPFCMLDEVDAPLDDANVGRFCDLVKEMSDQVQFIFITHNKITMALSNQLSGVTMHEPGVSRLVAVDVDEAVRLAAS
jgi:chromosome segregation protein